MGGVGKLDAAGDAVRSVIRAYHGSPYDFDRFDASKIGTGEGAQTYGHGLYFAGNEAVAKSYRDQLSRNSFLVEGASMPMTEATMDQIGIDTISQGIIRRALRDGADPLDRLRQARSGYAPLSARHNRLSDAIDILQSASGKLKPNAGRMYEVEIGHPEDALLDLDAPVGQQPANIQEALGKYGRAPDWFSMGQEGWRGDHAYTRMASELASENPRIIDGYHLTHDMPAASRQLLSAGVPGIRYFDGASRGQQTGTRNYVVFPGAEDSIRILRKFAIPGAVGAGAASMQESP